jgi:hypothetical protein
LEQFRRAAEDLLEGVVCSKKESDLKNFISKGISKLKMENRTTHG